MQRVALMMSQLLGKDATTLAHRLSDLAAVMSSSGQVWIYDMRQSDALPKTPFDTQLLYKFVRLLISNWFSAEEELYLENNIHITVCFFVWFLTKPNFFYKDNVTKQTTRNGIQRVWTPLLLGKKMNLQKEPVNAPAPKSQLSTTTDALLPKQQQQQENLRKDIVALLASTTLSNTSLEWDDQRRLHLKISECLTNTDSGLSIKQNKKLQKIYNEYTTITAKVNKTMLKIRKVERANAKIATPQKEPVWDTVLGPPPMSPPQLVRQSACVLPMFVDQTNQLADISDCHPDELDKYDGENNVPDSWEDL
tara:strand:- start:1183 stop:2106 length:924 start_codon:yes stop_codon:yes gene_type:complete